MCIFEVDVEKRRRLPEWLKKRLPSNGESTRTAGLLKSLRLSTVCQSAKCPNRGECFSRRVATFMIMGETCTRDCRFCSVDSGVPLPLDPDEPSRVAQAAVELGLRHVVITSVTRDDLSDGGSEHFAETVREVRELLPEATVELLVPDFLGDEAAIWTVVQAGPEIFNHNIETVPRLYALVRPEADYKRSLNVLRTAKRLAPDMITKSGIMLGLGETDEEVVQVLCNIREASCDMITIGQYLRPDKGNLPVKEFIAPEVFQNYEEKALSMGFRSAYCGPFVRSSYNAGEFVKKAGK